LAKADGHSYTESLKSGGITFILLVLLEAAPARAAAETGFRSSSISIGYIAYTAQIEIPSTELQTRVVSVCMRCGHPAAQLLQLLRVISVECVWDAVTVLPAAQ